MGSDGSKANTLSIEGLDAAYGAVRVIEDVSLTVAHGETVVLLGTNGNGKSTLMKCVMGIVPPAAGSSTKAMVIVEVCSAPSVRTSTLPADPSRATI